MPSELDGRPVEEIHETYDLDGTLTGTVIVTRGQRVTDVDRDELYALHERDAAMCPCGCGLPAAETHDYPGAWTVGSYKCTARAALDMAERDAHQKSLPKDQRDKTWKEGQRRQMDGLRFYIAGKTPTPPQPGTN